ncbi:MAG TPA: caspase family protein [Puia sp.]|nr:caspase family protein [Puia sp.]
MPNLKHHIGAIVMVLLINAATGQGKWALLVAINDYYEAKGVKSEVSLSGCVNDANSIRNLLIKKYHFLPSHVDTIYNGNATRDNIVGGLKRKLAQCKSGDAMLFYYSGHGVWLKNDDEVGDPVKKGMNQAMLTSDLYDFDDHMKCFLRDFTLKQWFNRFIDKKVVLTSLFDCCFSGSLAMAGANADLSEHTKSVDLDDILGVVAKNKANFQLWMDSVAGVPTPVPAGCPTDTSGRNTLADADGDGVPDCRDKERYTMKECLPVDSDGVGRCPEDIIKILIRDRLNRYDSAEQGIKVPAEVQEKSFSASFVPTVTEADTIQRPVYRKNSMFLFMSATTDLQKAVEFNDPKGVNRSLFTASLVRVASKMPENTPAEKIFEAVNADMASYHKSQTPTFYCDPKRKKTRLYY